MVGTRLPPAVCLATKAVFIRTVGCFPTVPLPLSIFLLLGCRNGIQKKNGSIKKNNKCPCADGVNWYRLYKWRSNAWRASVATAFWEPWSFSSSPVMSSSSLCQEKNGSSKTLLRSKQFKHNTSPRHKDAEGYVDVEPLRSSSSPPANNLGFQLCTSAIKRWPSAVLTDEAFWCRGAKLTCPSHAFFVQMLWLVIWYLQVNCHLNGTSMIQERMTL